MGGNHIVSTDMVAELSVYGFPKERQKPKNITQRKLMYRLEIEPRHFVTVRQSIFTAPVFAVTARRYPPELFSDDDPERALDVAEKVKFACIQPEDGTLCDAVFAPFVIVQRSGKALLEGHLVKTNPLYELLRQESLQCRLIFQAADGYVSPSIYPEKEKSGKVVPTWNYVAAQFSGKLSIVPDQELLALLENQVDQFEHSQESDWRLSDAPSDYSEQQSQAVFGRCFEPARTRTHYKLSQNRPSDKTGVIAWTKTLNTPHKSLAYWMGIPDEQ